MNKYKMTMVPMGHVSVYKDWEHEEEDGVIFSKSKVVREWLGDLVEEPEFRLEMQEGEN
jgi:hypothetical protein